MLDNSTLALSKEVTEEKLIKEFLSMKNKKSLEKREDFECPCCGMIMKGNNV